MNILILTRKFDGVVGGVEKMVLFLSQQMQLRHHTVIVVSLDKSDAYSFYDWPKGVTWIKIGIGNPDQKASFRNRVKRIYKIRKILIEHKVQTGIGFQIGSFVVLRLAAIGLHVKCIAAERNAPTLFSFIEFGRLKRFFSNFFLRFATVVSVQLEEHRYYYPWWLRNRIQIHSNPIQMPRKYRRNQPSKNITKIILYVGRITYQKNLEVLVEAVGKLTQKPLIRIIGEGDAIPKVISLAKFHEVKLDILTYTKDLENFYLGADIFCLPSRWEGFPNVVGEALSYGLPVVAFEECAGVKSLIIDGKSGVLAIGNDNSNTLATALNQALNSNWDTMSIRNSVKQFSVDHFADSWESTILEKYNYG